MFSRFGKIVTLLSVLLMAAVICFGFKTMSNVSSGKSQSIQLPPAIVSFGRQAMGIIRQVQPTEAVKHKLNEAGSVLNDVTKSLTQ